MMVIRYLDTLIAMCNHHFMATLHTQLTSLNWQTLKAIAWYSGDERYRLFEIEGFTDSMTNASKLLVATVQEFLPLGGLHTWCINSN